MTNVIDINLNFFGLDRDGYGHGPARISGVAGKKRGGRNEGSSEVLGVGMAEEGIKFVNLE